jgi:hypothetical protein
MVETKDRSVIRVKSELCNESSGYTDIEGNPLTELRVYEKAETILAFLDRYVQQSTTSSIELPIQLRESSLAVHQIALEILRRNSPLKLKKMINFNAKLDKESILLQAFPPSIITKLPILETNYTPQSTLINLEKQQQQEKDEKVISNLHKVLCYMRLAVRIHRILEDKSQYVYFTTTQISSVKNSIEQSKKLITQDSSQKKIEFDFSELLSVLDYDRESFLSYVFNKRESSYAKKLIEQVQHISETELYQIETNLTHFISSLHKQELDSMIHLTSLKTIITAPFSTLQRNKVLAKVKLEIDTYLRSKYDIFGIFYE